METSMTDEQQAEDLYTMEVSRYEAALSEDLDRAFQTYGFTLFHSLPASKQVALADTIGIQPRDAVDQYNLAGVAIEREDYKAAVDYLTKALDEQPDFADAAYNMALCQEKLSHVADARKWWTRYLETAPEGDETREAVQAHLDELPQ